jgi:hypothetical protein
MNCKFQTLYCGEDGYVVRCKECSNYQVAYLCVMVTLATSEFQAFCRMVQQHYLDSLTLQSDDCKCVVLETPASGTCFIFSRREIKRFAELLEEADNEEKTQELLELFRS